MLGIDHQSIHLDDSPFAHIYMAKSYFFYGDDNNINDNESNKSADKSDKTILQKAKEEKKKGKKNKIK